MIWTKQQIKDYFFWLKQYREQYKKCYEQKTNRSSENDQVESRDSLADFPCSRLFRYYIDRFGT